MDALLREQIEDAIIDASVPESATFQDALTALHDSNLPAIAVLGDDGKVVGLFGAKEVLRGLFPVYLDELKHSAFIADDVPGLKEHLIEVSTEPVTAFMAEPLVVDTDTSAIHIAEQLVHSDIRALALTENGQFIGMLGAHRFSWCVYRSLVWPSF